MPWTWHYLDEAGTHVADPAAEAFSSQSDAETWLGENWPELHAAGVMAVVLQEDDRTEYTMPLTPE